ncbi:MAG TPA: glycosyltransferase family 1 protein [Gemmatimonadaceae bacterium]|nr:glycosyltransferase family 1 protein [Gemmatimonadaceae bacterium]
MRIGIMLRCINYRGGIATYTQQLVRHMVESDRTNEYVLFYPWFEPARRSVGTFAGMEHVTEVLSRSPVPLVHYWDQVALPRLAHRYGVDIVFNPFVTIPVFGRFRKVFVMHNCEWYNMPEVFPFIERMWGRHRVDACMKAADRVISVSQRVADELVAATGLPADKFRVIYNAPSPAFQPVSDEERLRAVREKFGLRKDFLLFVGGIYPQKNFNALLRAFHAVRNEIRHDLVVAGMMRWKTGAEQRLMRELDLGDRLRLLGWTQPDDLVALYNAATCFVIPSYFESCSVALLEALACGCPVIASDAGGNPEVVRDAALLHHPDDVDALADAIRRVTSDEALRADLSARARRRSLAFGWHTAAEQTLRVLRETV